MLSCKTGMPKQKDNHVLLGSKEYLQNSMCGLVNIYIWKYIINK